MSEAATNLRGAEKSRIWLGVDILWPDGETEAIKEDAVGNVAA
jgi:hypothetical protein